MSLVISTHSYVSGYGKWHAEVAEGERVELEKEMVRGAIVDNAVLLAPLATRSPEDAWQVTILSRSQECWLPAREQVSARPGQHQRAGTPQQEHQSSNVALPGRKEKRLGGKCVLPSYSIE